MGKDVDKKGTRVDVYRPLVKCCNCELYEEVPINFGKQVEAESCPRCKCRTLMLVQLEKTRPKTKYVNE